MKSPELLAPAGTLRNMRYAFAYGADAVYQTMLWWNAQWRLDVDVTNATAAWCGVNIAGPKSREVMAAICQAATGQLLCHQARPLFVMFERNHALSARFEAVRDHQG